jgi:hypothetical protein
MNNKHSTLDGLGKKGLRKKALETPTFLFSFHFTKPTTQCTALFQLQDQTILQNECFQEVDFSTSILIWKERNTGFF